MKPYPNSTWGMKLNPNSTWERKLNSNATWGMKLNPNSTCGIKLNSNATWRMKLNPNKTHSIIVWRYKAALLQHLPLYLCGAKLETSTFLKLLGIVLGTKLTFEMHISNIATSIAQKTGLIRKCFKGLVNDDSVHRSFYAFVLSFFFEWDLKVDSLIILNLICISWWLYFYYYEWDKLVGPSMILNWNFVTGW